MLLLRKINKSCTILCQTRKISDKNEIIEPIEDDHYKLLLVSAKLICKEIKLG